ncbi:hypothetical protein HDU83_005218 [Entophlyctis luteolus]|nr:hypothetical protein HDU82_004291 [Entophlyctis luteolus]KAJ3344463.1 hypothetical protein HDU83_005218 [Entophlyctis luteolus]KAJ3388751.1 hypothetical protein HDU84_009447 [Entophlyctis sp. JEL0112]
MSTPRPLPSWLCLWLFCCPCLTLARCVSPSPASASATGPVPTFDYDYDADSDPDDHLIRRRSRRNTSNAGDSDDEDDDDDLSVLLLGTTSRRADASSAETWGWWARLFRRDGVSTGPLSGGAGAPAGYAPLRASLDSELLEGAAVDAAPAANEAATLAADVPPPELVFPSVDDDNNDGGGALGKPQRGPPQQYKSTVTNPLFPSLGFARTTTNSDTKKLVDEMTADFAHATSSDVPPARRPSASASADLPESTWSDQDLLSIGHWQSPVTLSQAPHPFSSSAAASDLFSTPFASTSFPTAEDAPKKSGADLMVPLARTPPPNIDANWDSRSVKSGGNDQSQTKGLGSGGLLLGDDPLLGERGFGDDD